MSETELKDFRQGMYDLFKEVATDKIFFHPLDPSVKPNIYGESMDKVYLAPIPLVGSVSTFTERNSQDKTSSIEINGIVVKFPFLSLVNIALKDLDRGKLSYEDKIYTVVTITPSDLFLGGYNFYTCKCIEG